MQLKFQTSYDTEADWDFVIVEAHEVGTDNWTTLPDANGHTHQDTGESCAAGWGELHPFLDHYQGADCSPTGTTGSLERVIRLQRRLAGVERRPAAVRRQAGRAVDQLRRPTGAPRASASFVDDATVTATARPSAQTSFEADLGGWTVAGAAPGSAANPNDWIRTTTAFEEGAGVTTTDTVYVGFGAEGLTTQAGEIEHPLDQLGRGRHVGDVEIRARRRPCKPERQGRLAARISRRVRSMAATIACIARAAKAICGRMASAPASTPPMRAAIIPVTPLQQNCSLVWCTRTMRGALVDPGGDLGRLKAAVAPPA